MRPGYFQHLIKTIAIAYSILLFGCSTTSKAPAQADASSSPAVSTDQARQVPDLAPELRPVSQAVQRVFKESVVIDTSRTPAFVVGDFNGDLSQDIAVILKPNAEKLSELNEQLPAWILRDVSSLREVEDPQLRIAPDEVLLAVIHGFGEAGWADPQASQTFLLKNAVGPHLRIQSAQIVLAANRGKKSPSLRGDVVAEILNGSSGFLYFSHSTYAWYDPKTFKGELELPRGHGARDQGNRK